MNDTAPNQTLLLEPGMSLIVGTVDAAGNPDSSRAWGVRNEGEHLRVLCDAASETALKNLRSTGRIAVTATDIATLRSAQVKGTVVAIDDTDDDDLAVFAAYWPALLQAIHDEQGTAFPLMKRMVPARLVAVTCTIEAAFNQTPGPGAGRRLVTA